ncbi:MAG: hypothetical protein IJL70_07530 [Treponema sp.]|nr:hypothetical protein [Treponema sp.]
MKKAIKVFLHIFFVFCGIQLFAQENKIDSLFSMRLTTDFAYYPKTEPESGGNHFAPLTGVYDHIECRTTFTANYMLLTPLGEHWLLKDANILFSGACELTPVSVRPQLSIGFQPFPFLVVKAGSSIGFGWNFMDFEGLCEFDAENHEYEKLSTFKHPYYEFWGQTMLMFDTGAVIPRKSDWNHVVMLASFTASYSGITGLGMYEPYEWQCTKNQFSGAKYEAMGLLAYQMPIALSRIGLMYSASGHFSGSDYGIFDNSYDGDFVTHSINPLLQLNLGKNDELFCLFCFSTRRSFDTERDKIEDELFMKTTGSEWYFRRIAISWTHRL